MEYILTPSRARNNRRAVNSLHRTSPRPPLHLAPNAVHEPPLHPPRGPGRRRQDLAPDPPRARRRGRRNAHVASAARRRAHGVRGRRRIDLPGGGARGRPGLAQEIPPGRHAGSRQTAGRRHGSARRRWQVRPDAVRRSGHATRRHIYAGCRDAGRLACRCCDVLIPRAACVAEARWLRPYLAGAQRRACSRCRE